MKGYSEVGQDHVRKVSCRAGQRKLARRSTMINREPILA